MSIGELRRVLRDSGVLGDAGGEPTPAELADVLWLAALRRGESAATASLQPTSGPAADNPHAQPQPESSLPPSVSAPDLPPAGPPEPAAGSHVRASLPRRTSSGASTTGVLLFAATRPQLADPLALARAMRPLRRRVPSLARHVVDEAATADLRAEQRLWVPALAPASEPAFDLALVIDDSESMALWSELIREFRLLCEQLGAFRDVRLWHLATSRDGSPGKPGLRGASRTSGLRDGRELPDPTGRRLILVVTDGVHPWWQPTGPLRPVLARWALANPLAIVQPFPQRLWHRSPLRPATAEFRPGWPGRGPTIRGRGSVAVPVLELTPGALSRWAAVISGTAGSTLLAAALLSQEPAADDEGTSNAPLGDAGQADPVRLVRDFRASVSPAAYRLTGYLSAVPLTLPVMRLVQESTMPETGPAELAEVFLSGLLRRSGRPGPAADAGSVTYKFAAGVRDVLHGTLTRDEALGILDTVGNYLVRGRRSGRRFPMVLESVPGGDDILAAAEQYPESFGRISGMLLERIGGPYAKAIQRKAAPQAAVPSELGSGVLKLSPSGPVSLSGSAIPENSLMLDADASPLAEFCAALRQLQQDSGADAVALAQKLNISRAQLYAILAGEIKRPPDWNEVVRPLVAACTGGNPAEIGRWRQRHAVLVEVTEELRSRDRPGGNLTGLPQVRYSLPLDTAVFTGRDAELDRIIAAVTEIAAAGGVVAIAGMPGIGKTALAVHTAHAVQDRFPDRQLFIDLHAHTPGREPVRPEDALAGLLAAAGTDSRFLPGDLDGRAALWREKMAGQRPLLVLDNAAGSSQVAPLLPGSEGCLVLVTSRRHLGDLPGAVTQVLVDVLPPAQAAEMFTRLAPRAADSPSEVAEVVALAGFLPLAISLLARLFTRHPAWTLPGLAAETRASLLTLTAESGSVAAAFEMSYRHLDPDRQRLFRLLGLHPGTTTDSYAAAALAETGMGEAAGLLDGLHGEGLLTETRDRRYGLHDLLRRYASDLAAADPAGDSERALERLLDYYQHAADRAEARLARQTRPGAPPGAPAGLPAGPELDDDGQALAWARAERANLLACLDYATAADQDARVIALTSGLAGLLRRDGPWAEAVTRHTAAARAAQRLGDRPGQANALNNLGNVRYLEGDYPAAARDLGQALGIYRDLGDGLGQANALSNLGIVRLRTGEYPAAAQALEQALAIYRDLGDQLGQANALSELGAGRWLTGDYPAAAQALEQALAIYRDLGHWLGQANALRELGVVQQLTGDYPAAAQALEQALAIYRDLGDRGGEATALNESGTLHRLSGDPARAERCHRQALELARAVAGSWDEAHALAGLGRCAIAFGDAVQAMVLLRQALEIFQRIGAADVPSLAAELDALTAAPPTQ